MRDEGAPDVGLDHGLIEELYRPLRRFAAVVGSPDIEPDDLLQEALVRTLRTRPLHELDDSAAYLRRVILNTARSQRRRRGRAQRLLPILGASSEGTAQPSYPSDIDDLLRLAPRQRAVLFLHDVEGLTFAEVGRALGMAPTTARMAATRARRRLREMLDEEVRP